MPGEARVEGYVGEAHRGATASQTSRIRCSVRRSCSQADSFRNAVAFARARIGGGTSPFLRMCQRRVQAVSLPERACEGTAVASCSRRESPDMTLSLRKGAAVVGALALSLRRTSPRRTRQAPRELRPIVADYIESGDIDKALAASRRRRRPRRTPRDNADVARRELAGGERNMPAQGRARPLDDSSDRGPHLGAQSRAKQGLGSSSSSRPQGEREADQVLRGQLVQDHPDVSSSRRARSAPRGQGPRRIPAQLAKTFPSTGGSTRAALVPHGGAEDGEEALPDRP